ncbi:hypothetical protein Tco_1101937 [Tanacetum coccineum]
MTTNQQQQISFHEYQMPCMLSQNYHEEALWDLEEQRQAGLDDDLLLSSTTIHCISHNPRNMHVEEDGRKKTR